MLEEGACVSLKHRFYLLLVIIAIGVYIGVTHPQPGP